MVSSTNKTDRHNIAEILLKKAKLLCIIIDFNLLQEEKAVWYTWPKEPIERQRNKNWSVDAKTEQHARPDKHRS